MEDIQTIRRKLDFKEYNIKKLLLLDIPVILTPSGDFDHSTSDGSVNIKTEHCKINLVKAFLKAA